MKLAVDSSVFAKRYIQEEGSEDIDLLLQRASDLALCIILLPEIIGVGFIFGHLEYTIFRA